MRAVPTAPLGSLVDGALGTPDRARGARSPRRDPGAPVGAPAATSPPALHLHYHRGMRAAPVLALALLSTAACDGAVGEDDPGPLANVLCQAPLTVTGQFMSSVTPPPTADQGCVPTGSWTINVAVADNGDCSAVDVLPTYTVQIVNTAPAGERPNNEITVTNAPAGAEVDTGLNASGNGACNLSLDILTPAPTSGQFHMVSLRTYVDPADTAARTIMAGPDSRFQLWKQHP